MTASMTGFSLRDDQVEGGRLVIELKTLNSRYFELNLKIADQFNIKEFDIIIDDGSHNLSDILIALKFFFKHLRSKGLYVIEDFKHPNYYQYNRNINHILVDEVLKNLENKKFFSSSIINKENKKYLINFI